MRGDESAPSFATVRTSVVYVCSRTRSLLRVFSKNLPRYTTKPLTRRSQNNG